MPKGLSLHIGLNQVDPSAYGGWTGPLTACEFDADDMTDIAESNGFTTTKLLTKHATRDRVRDVMQAAAESLQAGDIFFISYSGHGGQVKDLDGDEFDNLDETWCLYDGQLVDDELQRELYANFKSGVRVLVISDSCHSGTIIKASFRGLMPSALKAGSVNTMNSAGAERAMPLEVVAKAYRARRDLYGQIDSRTRMLPDEVEATILLISGCQDNQYSYDGPLNGQFTGRLLQVLASGVSIGGYKQFHRSIAQRMPPEQTPNFYTIGPRNPAFEAGTPFSI